MNTDSCLRPPSVGLLIIINCRYAVLASSAITFYCLSYLIDQHWNHFCTWEQYGYIKNCTPEQKENITVPWAEVDFIFAVSIKLFLHVSHIRSDRTIVCFLSAGILVLDEHVYGFRAFAS
jgi:hypothetical protein